MLGRATLTMNRSRLARTMPTQTIARTWFGVAAARRMAGRKGRDGFERRGKIVHGDLPGMGKQNSYVLFTGWKNSRDFADQAGEGGLVEGVFDRIVGGAEDRTQQALHAAVHRAARVASGA